MPRISSLALLKTTFDKWSADKASQLGAALAYYAIFSLVPLVLLTIKICSIIFGEDAARGTVVAQIQNVVGETMAHAIEELLKTAKYGGQGTLATIIGLITMLIGASGMFVQLRDALNTIWGVAPRPGRGIWTTVQNEATAFAMVALCGILMLATLLVTAFLAAIGSRVSGVLPSNELLMHLINTGFSFVLVTALVGLIFKFVSAARISWADALRGALVTALLFVVGKVPLGIYLGKSSISTAFGAASSVILIVLWVYYSAQILFFGAEFAAVYAELRGKRIEPSREAVVIPKHA